jgi:hypothetical protein
MVIFHSYVRLPKGSVMIWVFVKKRGFHVSDFSDFCFLDVIKAASGSLRKKPQLLTANLVQLQHLTTTRTKAS